jgi:hypothetical protein
VVVDFLSFWKALKEEIFEVFFDRSGMVHDERLTLALVLEARPRYVPNHGDFDTTKRGGLRALLSADEWRRQHA